MPKIAKFPYLNDNIYVFDGKPRSYRYLHILIQRKYGKAQRCEAKICTGLSIRFQWANVSGTYSTSDRSDWLQLCRSCHVIRDVWNSGRKERQTRDPGSYIGPKKSVTQLDKNGNSIKVWPSITEVSETLSINGGNISSAISGRYKTAGGYKWRFTNKMS